jgi:2'-hydroxyisoflavone reductase
MTTRREFLGFSASALAVYAAGLQASVQPATKPLDILFLGGTGFLGPHQINHALARGHRVTMFNRGSNAGMYGDRVEELVGNRDDNVDAGLSALRGDRRWDVVVDNSGYVPRHVRDSVELLKDRCGRYIYVSTVAVYDFEGKSGLSPRMQSWRGSTTRPSRK